MYDFLSLRTGDRGIWLDLTALLHSYHRLSLYSRDAKFYIAYNPH